MTSVLCAVALAAAAPAATSLGVDQCVAAALADSAAIDEAEAKVHEYEARLAEVQSAFYPKLSALAFVAPMFTVDFRGVDRDVERRWLSLSDWGPYARLEALLAQPLYSFGRFTQGETAARERVEVERARLREARQLVALEVHRLYYTVLYAQSLLPTLENAAGAVAEAERKGQEMYEQSTGDVTQADLQKLRYAATEVAKYQLRATQGAAIALAALKHTLGWPAERQLELAEVRLVAPSADASAPELTPLMAEAAERRPEWAQIEHGRKATLAWSAYESMANLPIAFLAGQFRAGWTPTRDDLKNPYLNDPYNELFGGVALGLKLDLDPMAAGARADVARATGEQVEALARFAATGIPLQVKKAHTELLQAHQVATLSAEGARATRKWMTFAAAAFMTGTGEARDLLEGLAAYVQARNAEYEGLRDYFTARAELDWAVGRIGEPARD